MGVGEGEGKGTDGRFIEDGGRVVAYTSASLPRRRRGGRGARDRSSGRPDLRPRMADRPRATKLRRLKTVTRPTVRVIPLGGVEEIGKNATLLEYYDPQTPGELDLMIVDLGSTFPDADMPGVDLVIPDVTYLEDKIDKIRGIVITHGHMDHIGAIPYLLPKLGFPTIYSAPLTIGFIKKRLEEHRLLDRAKLEVMAIGEAEVKLGAFTVSSFRLNHSIPDATGLNIETPVGRLIWASDWKFDHTPGDGRPTDFQTIDRLGSDGVLCLFSESTNIERPGHSISEREVEATLAEIFEQTRGRLIVAMFSTLIARVQQVINLSAKHGRKVALAGRSLVQNSEVALEMKALSVPKDVLVDIRRIGNIPPEKLTLITTGAQGEEMSALTRMAAGEHRQVTIRKNDTVVISASPIPGNERAVQEVMDDLIRSGAAVIYHKTMDVHTSGHAYREDLRLMIRLTRPEYFVPIHGDRAKLLLHGQLAVEEGVKVEQVLISDNGQIIEFTKDDGSLTGVVTNERVPAGIVTVDGLGVGDVGNIVLRDRRVMASDGIFMVVVTVERSTGKLLTSPDIISRGFIYMRENVDLVHAARQHVRKMFQKHGAGPHAGDWQLLRQRLRDELGEFLYKHTERRPMVVPVIIEV